MRALFMILFSMATLCRATAITVTFTPDTLNGNPGNTLMLFGSLLNNTNSTAFINSDSFTFAIPGAVDDSLFLNNAPISLGPNASSGTFEFLTVTIPNGQGAGAYDGAFTVLGGADGTAQNNLGSTAFHVTVAVATPEPSSLPVLGIGAVVFFLCRSRANRPRGSAKIRVGSEPVPTKILLM